MKTGLPRLKRLPASRYRPKSVKLPRPPRVRNVSQKRTGPPPHPFNSWWEYDLNAYLLKKDPYWEAQAQYGNSSETLSTRPDWINRKLMKVIYLDGPVHAFRDKAPRDAELRKVWPQQDYGLVEWAFQTEEEMWAKLDTLYRRDIGG